MELFTNGHISVLFGALTCPDHPGSSHEDSIDVHLDCYRIGKQPKNFTISHAISASPAARLNSTILDPAAAE